LSRIDTTEETQHFEIVHSEREKLVSGNIIPLERTYRRRTTAAPDGTLAVDDPPED